MKNHQQIYPKSFKTLSKSKLGLVPGALGGGLGSHFVSQGRLGQQKGARRPKCVHFWGSIWKPFFDFFLDSLILFCTLFSSFHFGRYQNRFLMDFGAKMGAKMHQNSYKYRFFEKVKNSQNHCNVVQLLKVGLLKNHIFLIPRPSKNKSKKRTPTNTIFS